MPHASLYQIEIIISYDNKLIIYCTIIVIISIIELKLSGNYLKNFAIEFFSHYPQYLNADDGNDADRGDYIIKMCTIKDQADFITIHHEMDHKQFYQQYAHHPILFRDKANPGFHEAIGDTLALAVSTQNHLQKGNATKGFNQSKQNSVGLPGDNIQNTPEADMN